MNTIDIVDAHAHLAMPGNLFENHEASPEDLILQMDIASVDMAVILAVASEKGNLKATRKYNDFIADTVKRFSDRFIGFGSVHPEDGRKAAEELDRFPDLGLKGVKLHPVLQNFHCNSEGMNLIAEKCEDLAIPVLIHSHFLYDASESEGLYRLTVKNEETAFILAHMGGHTFLDLYSHVERRRSGRDNVYFDISSVAVMFRRSPYTSHIAWLIQQMGADRVVFGSNYPKYHMVDALTAFDELGLPFKESQQVLGKTIAELLKL